MSILLGTSLPDVAINPILPLHQRPRNVFGKAENPKPTKVQT
jgi:hypothetical protein